MDGVMVVAVVVVVASAFLLLLLFGRRACRTDQVGLESILAAVERDAEEDARRCWRLTRRWEEALWSVKRQLGQIDMSESQRIG